MLFRSDGVFTPDAAYGGFLGVLVIGLNRAVFSNEAGVGSAAIAHSAAKVKYPVEEGVVALLEPFIDTVIVCTMTALVIIITGVYNDPAHQGIIDSSNGGMLTSEAFKSQIEWFPVILALAVFLFAFSTMISWSYYGLEGFIYIFGPKRWAKTTFNTMFCLFIIVGSTTRLDAVLDFSDAMVFAMALANVLALYLLGPTVKRELNEYWQLVAAQDGQHWPQST